MPYETFAEQAAKLLEQGTSIIVFPEGTRSGGREMGQFHGAVFRLALAVRCPIVPLCIVGNERIPPKGSCLLQPGGIRVRKLPAVNWQEYRDLSPFVLKNRVRDTIAAELARMEGAEERVA